MASLGPSSLRLLASHSSPAHCPATPVHTQRVRLRSTCLYHTASQPEKRREPPLERRSALAVGCRPGATADILGLPLGPSLRTATAPRLRVAVDVDEVLGRFVYALNQYCKETHGMDYAVGDYWVYEFAKIWNCSQDRSNTIVHDFFKSPHFNQGIPIIPGAYDTLQRLSTFCDLVVVTSRQHIIQDVTLQWIDTHYPGLFSEVYFGNHFALQGTSRKKSEICKSIGAHVLIDDNPTYAEDCATAGMHVLLFDWEHAYPWSKMPPGSKHPKIKVVRDWREAELALMALVPGSQA